MKIGLYVDVSNLYFCLYNNLRAKLNYAELIEFISPIGEVVLAKAYGAQVKDEAAGFIKLLHKLGYTTYYKEPKHYGDVSKADWDVGIAVDIIRDLDNVDMVALITADGDMVPLAQYVLDQGKKVLIMGSNISKELQDVATTYIEIPSSLVIPLRRQG